MKNKVHNLILIGICLNITQWIVILLILLNVMAHFDGYTVYNPNVTNGSMTSFSFIDWLVSMIYSGVPFNYIVFIVIVACLLYLIPTTIFIVLEIIAYFMIRREGNSFWTTFILAMGVKNAVIDLSGIPFLVAGFMMYKENKVD